MVCSSIAKYTQHKYTKYKMNIKKTYLRRENLLRGACGTGADQVYVGIRASGVKAEQLMGNSKRCKCTCLPLGLSGGCYSGILK